MDGAVVIYKPLVTYMSHLIANDVTNKKRREREMRITKVKSEKKPLTDSISTADRGCRVNLVF